MIDIHTHTENTGPSSVCTIRNIRIGKSIPLIPIDGLYSVGLHPWDTGTVDFIPDYLDQLSNQPNVLAIGECGLDKLRGAEIGIQKEIFKQQALIAEKHRKPLIIHCVQSWQEIIALNKDIHPKVPWIVHGFRGKPGLEAQLLEHGFYLSFGSALLKPGSISRESFRMVPPDRFFLETDDSLDSIEDIYHIAAEIKGLSVNGLISCVSDNFKSVFKK